MLKGATLNAKASALEMSAALSEVAEDLQRQVDKLRDKRIGKRARAPPRSAISRPPPKRRPTPRSSTRALAGDRPGRPGARRYPAAHGSAGQSAEHR